MQRFGPNRRPPRPRLDLAPGDLRTTSVFSCAGASRRLAGAKRGSMRRELISNGW
jgi:hypothetical protein